MELGDVGGAEDSPVINDSGEFVPMAAPAASAPVNPGVRMPTPNQVVHLSDDKRLDTVPFEFADIRALAQRILKRATEQGQAKIASANKQVAAMEKAAYDKAYKEAFPKGQEEGFAKGEKEGQASAQKQINDAVAAEKEALKQSVTPITGVLEQIANAFVEARNQLLAQAEGDLLMLAIDLAKRLVGHELSVDSDAVKPLAVECIGLVTDRSSITVRVNPEDHRIMEEFVPELKTIFPDMGPVQVVSDPEVERGGIMAATREAEVDMRLATRLSTFEEVILGFSGQDAVAPWSAIPEEAIEAARAANAESPYSLYEMDNEPEEEQPVIELEPQAEEEAAPAEESQPEGDLADLAELADLAGDVPPEEAENT